MGMDPPGHRIVALQREPLHPVLVELSETKAINSTTNGPATESPEWIVVLHRVMLVAAEDAEPI